MNDIRSLLSELRRACPELVIAEEEPLSKHCSFRIGGPCDAMLFPTSAEEIERICRVLRSGDERPFVMGNGTNLLFPDAPLHRIVLHMGDEFSALREVAGHVTAESGCKLSRLALFAASRSLAGLEFAHGIPGTVGGGVSMNAGAYGGEMKDVFCRALWLDSSLSLRESNDAALSYRHSRFSDTEDIILEAEFALPEGDESEIRERIRVLAEKRRASQPLELPSAGSTFKRPVGGYAAALIDQAGLKGYAVGGACVSEKHAGFVVNRGGASCEDVLRLMEHIQETVLRTSGITLEPEVKIIRA